MDPKCLKMADAALSAVYSDSPRSLQHLECPTK